MFEYNKTVMESKSSTAPFFRQTRVNSCNTVVAKNGRPMAVPFSTKKTGYKAPNSWTNQSRSSEVISHARATHTTFSTMHAGMQKKPLFPYDPNSHRSRLPTSDFVIPYKNTSQVEIGERSSYNPKSSFRSTYMASMPGPDMHDLTSNQGIISEKTKWIKKRISD